MNAKACDKNYSEIDLGHGARIVFDDDGLTKKERFGRNFLDAVGDLQKVLRKYALEGADGAIREFIEARVEEALEHSCNGGDIVVEFSEAEVKNLLPGCKVKEAFELFVMALQAYAAEAKEEFDWPDATIRAVCEFDPGCPSTPCDDKKTRKIVLSVGIDLACDPASAEPPALDWACETVAEDCAPCPPPARRERPRAPAPAPAETP
jgi:hypothetical protein